MKAFTPFPLVSHAYKKPGLLVALLCMPLLVAAQWLNETAFLSSTRVTNLLILIIALGLNAVAFSREKQDDERVKAIRYASYRITLSLIIIFLVSFASVSVFSTAPVALDAGVLAFFFLVTYLIVFYAGLYSDMAAFYANNSATDNFHHYRRQILGYLVPITVLTLVCMVLVVVRS